MRNWLVAFAVTIGVLFGAGGGTGPYHPAEAAGWPDWSAVRLSSGLDQMLHETVVVDMGDGHGSGVVVSSWQVLTALHVVQGRDTATIRFYDGQKRTGKVLQIWPDLDLAVIGLSVPEGTPAAHLRCNAVDAGEPVTAIGHPMFVEWQVARGFVGTSRISIKMTVGRRMPPWVALDLSIQPGNSGGPIFDASGRVVGLANAIPNFRGQIVPTIGLMVPASAFCETLDRAGVG